jgi:hypothetical protein
MRFKVVIYPDRDDERPVTVDYADSHEEAVEIARDLVAAVKEYGTVASDGADFAWPVPALVVRKHKQSWRLRLECWDGERGDGYEFGFAWMRIVGPV